MEMYATQAGPLQLSQDRGLAGTLGASSPFISSHFHTPWRPAWVGRRQGLRGGSGESGWTLLRPQPHFQFPRRLGKALGSASDARQGPGNLHFNILRKGKPSSPPPCHESGETSQPGAGSPRPRTAPARPLYNSGVSPRDSHVTSSLSTRDTMCMVRSGVSPRHTAPRGPHGYGRTPPL